MPVLATPTTGNSVFLIETDTQVVRPGSPLGISGYDRVYPNTPYTVEMRRRRADEARNSSTDPVVETYNLTTDADGFFSITWNPSTDSGLLGPKYRYYPRLVNVNDTTRWAVPAAPRDVKVYNRTYGLLDAVTDNLGSIQDIHIYDLKSKDSNYQDQSKFRFTYGNWRLDYEPLVYLADGDAESLQSDGFTIDYDEGSVTFSNTIPPYQDVHASFAFGLFSEDDLRLFLRQSLQELNAVKPITKDIIDNMPEEWEPFVVYGAVLKALHRVRMDVLYKERQLLFANTSFINQLSAYESYLDARFTWATQNKNRWSRTQPHAITGFDVVAPPRVTPQNFGSMAYLRGRAL